MTDSTRRSLRTAYQALIAALTTIPIILGILTNVLPADSAAAIGAYLAAIVGGMAAVTKIVNALEDAGLIPAWLKGDVVAPAPAPEPAPAPAPVPAEPDPALPETD